MDSLTARTRAGASSGVNRRMAFGRIAIRRFTPDDAPALVRAVRESMVELKPWMPWCHPGYSLQDASTFIQTAMDGFAKRTGFEFAITSGGAVVGVSGI